ncbi:MAG: helix-turn-helix domain-containing protein [Xenococcaceae cyanobacterium]
MTFSTYQNSNPILPTEEDASVAKASSKTLASLGNNQPYCTIKVKGETITIPAAALDLLVDILALMGQGNAVELTPIPSELDLYQAADILGVSRPYLVGLLKSGEIPYRIEGIVYRMRYEDVVDYKNRNDTERMKALEKLAAQAQELNMGY